jgi:hypothetical protein
MTDIYRQTIDRLIAQSESLDSVADDLMQSADVRSAALHEQEQLRQECRQVADDGWMGLADEHFLDLLLAL